MYIALIVNYTKFHLPPLTPTKKEKKKKKNNIIFTEEIIL